MIVIVLVIGNWMHINDFEIYDCGTRVVLCDSWVRRNEYTYMYTLISPQNKTNMLGPQIRDNKYYTHSIFTT